MTLDEVEKLARGLMAQHGVSDWDFAFDRAQARFGCCHWRTRKITLSRYHAEHGTEADITETILHEIAHALAGVSAKHGLKWKIIARRIGANPKATSDRPLHAPPPKYQGTCPGCGQTSKARRRTKAACAACCDRHNGGRFDPRFLLTWSSVRPAESAPEPEPITPEPVAPRLSAHIEISWDEDEDAA